MKKIIKILRPGLKCNILINTKINIKQNIGVTLFIFTSWLEMEENEESERISVSHPHGQPAWSFC